MLQYRGVFLVPSFCDCALSDVSMDSATNAQNDLSMVTIKNKRLQILTN